MSEIYVDMQRHPQLIPHGNKGDERNGEQVSHNLKNTTNAPIPVPPPGAFGQYALFKAHVPEMWVSYEVLAK